MNSQAALPGADNFASSGGRSGSSLRLLQRLLFAARLTNDMSFKSHKRFRSVLTDMSTWLNALSIWQRSDSSEASSL